MLFTAKHRLRRKLGQVLDLENVETMPNTMETSKAAQIFSRATLKTPSGADAIKKFTPSLGITYLGVKTPK